MTVDLLTFYMWLFLESPCPTSETGVAGAGVKYDLGRQGRANSVFEGMQMSLSYSADGRRGKGQEQEQGQGQGKGKGKGKEQEKARS